MIPSAAQRFRSRLRPALRSAARGPQSVRSRLLLASVVLSLAAVLAVGIATYFSLGSYLRNNLDKQLQRNAPDVLQAANTENLSPFDRDTAITLYTASGDPYRQVTTTVLPWVAPNATGLRYHNVTASDGRAYRVVAVPVASRTAVLTLVYGLPQSQVDNVLHRLLLLEIAVSTGVVVLLVGVGLVLVKVGLRPLARIGDTAGAIAAGDLSRRVETTNARTEVGRLGISLNAMLTQIEDEIAQRTASEERLRRFIADASHELRTPLTSIRGYAELFRRGAATRPDDLALVMRRIEAEAGRMGGLVEDLLLLARLDEGRPLNRAPVDLADLAADAGADARVLDPDRSVEVTVEGQTVVNGDDSRLRQVLSNLVRNVLAHTPTGTPFGIRVRGDDENVTVDVWDRGAGLDEETAAHAFDRFWRADLSRQRDDALSGSGLGLSIVAALTEAHGGTVTALETPGGGATFRIVIPAAMAPEAVDVSAPA